MIMIDIINKKRNKQNLNKKEIDFAVNGFVNGTIPDYQMSALLMSIVLNGMSDEETINLTDVMLHSGEILDLDIGTVVDKHSTGGVGDKTTLILAPLVASCNVKVAKMSGRGLGHTGGTIDKLESIEGFNTSINLDQFKKQVSKIGVALVGQMGNLVPADKKIYALRDVTGTVESIPLIASSIMSKKLASGSNKIVIDLKVGDGAFMKNMKNANALARLMCLIGKKYNKKTICVITNMNEPLGCAVGNSLEVLESINTLKNKGPKDLTDLIIMLGTLMVSLGKNISEEDAKKEVIDALETGKAYKKFIELVNAQGGNINKIKIADKSLDVLSSKNGYIKSIKTTKLGDLVRDLGAGRLTKNDIINPKVGMLINKKIGDKVCVNESLVTIYFEDKNINIQDVLDCFEIVNEKTSYEKLIKKIIR